MLGPVLNALLPLNSFDLTVLWGVITRLLSPFYRWKPEAQRGSVTYSWSLVHGGTGDWTYAVCFQCPCSLSLQGFVHGWSSPITCSRRLVSRTSVPSWFIGHSSEWLFLLPCSAADSESCSPHSDEHGLFAYSVSLRVLVKMQILLLLLIPYPEARPGNMHTRWLALLADAGDPCHLGQTNSILKTSSWSLTVLQVLSTWGILSGAPNSYFVDLRIKFIPCFASLV